MKQKYIVLTISGFDSISFFDTKKIVAARSLEMISKSKLKIDEVELDASGLTDYVKKKKPLSVAPAMPVSLIKPYSSKAKPSAVSWGVEAVKANVSSFTGKGVKMAILDTGIDRSHAAFKGIKIAEEDFTGEGKGDTNGHGTHCAGTAFGRDVGGNRIGVARGVDDILIGKVLGEKGGGSSEMIIQALQWSIKNGANIISMSLGIDFPGYVKRLIDQEGLPKELAASKALAGYRANFKLFESFISFIKIQSDQQFSQPVTVVAAAGNESRLDINPDFEIGVSLPAVAEGIISVAALSQVGNDYGIAPFSNSGAVLSAPGVDILSAQSGGGLATMSGTSMATPHVAGVLALWYEKLTAEGEDIQKKLIPSLQTTCDVKGLRKQKSHLYGWGLVQAPIK